MCAPEKDDGLCVCATSDGLPEIDPTEWPYIDDAAGPSKGRVLSPPGWVSSPCMFQRHGEHCVERGYHEEGWICTCECDKAPRDGERT